MKTTMTRTLGRSRLPAQAALQTLATLLTFAGCQTMPPDPLGQSGSPPGSSAKPPVDTQGKPLPTVAVDASVRTTAEPLPPHEDGSPRPVAVATDKSNLPVEFVEDELIVVTDNMAALDAFIKRWNGVLLQTHDPVQFGLEGEQVHLVRVKTAGADRARLQANLVALDSKSASQIRVGSESGANLLAVAAQEAVGGLSIGINFIHRDAGARDRNIKEAATGDPLRGLDNGQTEAYDANPFKWSYMKVGGAQNIGVAEAWSVLDRAGKLNNKVKICIIDGGFADGTEYPQFREHNNATVNAVDPTQANQVECTGGSSCPWHGVNVVEACMGKMDNGMGAAGPAAPVATLLTVRRSGDIFNNISAISVALFSGANIINMSFHARVPATLSWSVVPFSVATKRARSAGKLIFASAGNDGEDIDAEDCFIVCWEEAWHTPIENGGVIGVGAMDLNTTSARSDSNYGSEELDIYGPGVMWVGPDPATQRVHSFGATSGASPFVAGVAALIWAANPGLTNDDVWQVMWETSNAGNSGRLPNALAAVVRALGNTPPELSNVKVERAGFTGRSLTCSCEAFDVEDGMPNIIWRSDVSGVFGTGTLAGGDLPYGRHVITCSATDSKGSEVIETRVFELVNAPPRVLIQQPVADATYFAGQLAYFEAFTTDLESGKKLPEASVSWQSDREGALGTGHGQAKILRTVGMHKITLTGVDVDGTSASTSINVWVQAPPPDGLPPTAYIYNFDYNPNGNKVDEMGRTYIDLVLGGNGHDAEDGYLLGDKLTWTLDTPGAEWNVTNPTHGQTAFVRLYPASSPSDFRVTLTVRDTSGKTATATRTGSVSFVR